MLRHKEQRSGSFVIAGCSFEVKADGSLCPAPDASQAEKLMSMGVFEDTSKQTNKPVPKTPKRARGKK